MTDIYYERRPEYTALQLRMDNREEIEKLLGHKDFGFHDDKTLVVRLFSNWISCNQSDWIVCEPYNGDMEIVSHETFLRKFERAKND